MAKKANDRGNVLEELFRDEVSEGEDIVKLSRRWSCRIIRNKMSDATAHARGGTFVGKPRRLA